MRLTADPGVAGLVNRVDTARRERAREVFPVAAKSRTPTAAFTAPCSLPELELKSDVLE
jgi:hypothetical protein